METVESAPRAEPRQSSYRKRVELLSVVLITLAGGVSAWCGFQASLWDGEQMSHYNRGAARRVESTRMSTLANQQTNVDISLFTAWLGAVADRKPLLRDFYRDRFRPEFKRAFEAWLAMDPLTNAQAPKSPFASADYELAAAKRAAELEVEAVEEGTAGDEANDRSDRYGRAGLVAALVLVFAGLSQQFRVRGVQLTMLGISVVLLVASIGFVAALPRAYLE